MVDGKVIDEVVQFFGVCKYEIVVGKGFFLNGEKYLMYGVICYQDWWGLGSVFKNEYYDFDLVVIMDVGVIIVCFVYYQ